MTPLPSRRLLVLGAAAATASLAVLAFPAAWLLLLAANVVLLLAALFDWLITPRPHLVEATRQVPARMSMLTEQAIVLLIKNNSAASLSLRVRDTIPEAFPTACEELAGVAPAASEARWEYRIKPSKRGAFAWGPLHLRYRSLLGLWELPKTIAADAVSRVYPSLEALERYHLLARANRLETLGIRKVRIRGGAWEFESLREYAFGDDIRLIDWKATARRHKAIVRNQEAERNQTVLLMVDCGRLMNAEENGVAKLDHAVNTALMLSHIALSRGDRVGLCTFSRTVHAWVAPRAHVGQMHLLTESLYDLRGDFTETDHGRCLRLLASRHRKHALLVVLTDFVDAETAADMVAHLQLAARRHVVLFAALNDPLLDRAARSRPATALEGFRKSSAVELLHERREVLERLRQIGAHVLDAAPAGVTPHLINQYLEITFRGLI